MRGGFQVSADQSKHSDARHHVNDDRPDLVGVEPVPVRPKHQSATVVGGTYDKFSFTRSEASLTVAPSVALEHLFVEPRELIRCEISPPAWRNVVQCDPCHCYPP